MKLTKYAHACFSVELNEQVLIADPGNLSPDLPEFENVCALVITHQHADHFDPQRVAAIVERNPALMIYAHASVATLCDPAWPVTPVEVDQQHQVGPFTLVFFGGEHSTIHTDIPPIDNLGIVINGALGYPGDALIAPPRPVDTLLLPLAAPWCKISEVIEFARSCDAARLLPTHDAILSPAGKGIYDRVLSSNLSDARRYQRDEIGASIAITTPPASAPTP